MYIHNRERERLKCTSKGPDPVPRPQFPICFHCDRFKKGNDNQAVANFCVRKNSYVLMKSSSARTSSKVVM